MKEFYKKESLFPIYNSRLFWLNINSSYIQLLKTVIKKRTINLDIPKLKIVFLKEIILSCIIFFSLFLIIVKGQENAKKNYNSKTISEGKVVKEYVLLPIEGARISFNEESIFTDRDGKFIIPQDWNSGILNISKFGYECQQYELKNGSLKKANTTISLKRDISYIPEIVLGDTLPEIFWDIPLDLYNSQRQLISLREYQDKKILILDFWATWCSPCIENIEKWLTLLPEYKDNIAVIGIHCGRQDRLPIFFKNRNWNIPIIEGENHRLISSFFFNSDQVGQCVLIKDGIFYAAPKNQGHDRDFLNKLINEQSVLVENDSTYLHKKGGVK